MQSIRSDRSSTKYLGNQGQADAMMEMSERGGLCITVFVNVEETRHEQEHEHLLVYGGVCGVHT